MSSLLRHAKSNVSPALAGLNPGPAVLAQPETGIIPRKQDAHFYVITEHPMNALERRTVSSLALLYSFRMLGLFMVLPLLALYRGPVPGRKDYPAAQYLPGAMSDRLRPLACV